MPHPQWSSCIQVFLQSPSSLPLLRNLISGYSISSLRSVNTISSHCLVHASMLPFANLRMASVTWWASWLAWTLRGFLLRQLQGHPSPWGPDPSPSTLLPIFPRPPLLWTCQLFLRLVCLHIVFLTASEKLPLPALARRSSLPLPGLPGPGGSSSLGAS